MAKNPPMRAIFEVFSQDLNLEEMNCSIKVFAKSVVQKKLLKLAESGLESDSPADQIEVRLAHASASATCWRGTASKASRTVSASKKSMSPT